MSDADELDLSEFGGIPISGQRCTVCELLPKLVEDRRHKLEAAFQLDQRRLSGQKIYETVNFRWGHSVGLHAVLRHRRERHVGE